MNEISYIFVSGNASRYNDASAGESTRRRFRFLTFGRGAAFGPTTAGPAQAALLSEVEGFCFRFVDERDPFSSLSDPFVAAAKRAIRISLRPVASSPRAARASLISLIVFIFSFQWFWLAHGLSTVDLSTSRALTSPPSSNIL
jgi:hypothetical protein